MQSAQKKDKKKGFRWALPRSFRKSQPGCSLSSPTSSAESADSATFVLESTDNAKGHSIPNMNMPLQKWLDCMNDHDTDRLEMIFHQDCSHIFTVATMNNRDFIREVNNMFDAFPDFNFTLVRDIEEEPTDMTCPNTGQRVVKQSMTIVAKGTHNGIAYGFGPYPPVDAKGTKVELDPEAIIIHVNVNDKGKYGEVFKVEIIPQGPDTGPAGLYVKVGGFPL